MKVITFGRHNSSDVVINDPKVSRNHLQIVQDDKGNLTLVDLNSTNGTFVNGKRVSGEVSVTTSDIITIGSATLQWQSYFKNEPAPSVINRPADNSTVKSKRIGWIILAVSVALLLVVVGIIFVYTNNKQKTEREKIELQAQASIEAAQADADKRVQEADVAAQRLIRANAELDSLSRIAAYTKSAEDIDKRKQAEVKQQEAVAEVETTQTKLSKANDSTEQIRKESIEKENALAAEKLEAENKSRADSIARVSAETEAKTKALTAEFYKNIQQLKNGILQKDDIEFKKVCQALGYTIPENTKAKDFLEKKFLDADNAEKDRIIKVVNTIKKNK